MLKYQDFTEVKKDRLWKQTALILMSASRQIWQLYWQLETEGIQRQANE
jgi:hypothetical protein